MFTGESGWVRLQLLQTIPPAQPSEANAHSLAGVNERKRMTGSLWLPSSLRVYPNAGGGAVVAWVAVRCADSHPRCRLGPSGESRQNDALMTDQEVLELPKVWQNRPNVKAVMLDTQVYSNTGGQNSDSTPMLGGNGMSILCRTWARASSICGG